MDDYDRLLSFAEHVRREAFQISAELFRKLGVEDETAQRVAQLCTEAATIKARAQMEREQAAVDDLDLSTLPAPSDNPFRED